MQTTIQQVNDVEYELEIHGTADDLAPEINKALRAQRARTQMKGFRPGKVPMKLVKKLHGRAIAYDVADKAIQKTYEQEVMEADELDVLGQPTITKLEYDLDEDLHAVIRFGVRPDVELKDLSDETLLKLRYDVTEEDVEQEIRRLREEQADLVPVEDEGAGEDDQVLIDMQRLDDESGTPIIGEKEEDVEFFLSDDRLKDELRDALLGKKAGDTFRVDLPHEAHADAEEGHAHAHDHTHAYEVTVKDVKRRELPEVDEDFIQEVTDGKFEDEDAFRAEIERQLKAGWDKRIRELTDEQIVERMIELHPVPVPPSVIEMYLDSFMEDVKRQLGDEVPETFDETAFRQANRADAEKQARWMLIRDKVLDENDLEVTDEDRQAHFEEAAAGSEELDVEMLARYYRSVPGLMDQLNQRLLTEKVFRLLEERFDVEELEREAYQERVQAARTARQANAEIAAPAVDLEDAPAPEDTSDADSADEATDETGDDATEEQAG